MSHIAEMTTTIENPDRALLRQAVQVVADQHEGGEIRTYYLDYDGDTHRVPLALATAEMYRGVGIVVKEKKLTFIGDGFGYRKLYAQVQQQVIQSYISLATMQALQALGYQTTAEDGEQGRVVLTGVNYA
jgi:hypothetical protein